MNTHSDIPNTAEINGVITLYSRHSIDEVQGRLEQLLHDKGVKLFAVIDHGGEARKVGLRMPATKLLIFGNPQAGTPLMLASPTVAIDLPLKVLIWEDEQRRVWVSYNSVDYLTTRHQLPESLRSNIAAVETLARLAAE